ncbi:MAG: MBG domain-containing protein [Ginsengibacter sp.]
MRRQLHEIFSKGIYFLILASIISAQSLFAQQTQITDYVIFGGKTAPGQTMPASPGYGVLIGSSCNVKGEKIAGSIGSYHLVKSTGGLVVGTTSMPGNIFSGGTIQLANKNVVTGRLSAAGSTGTVISVGSNATIGGNIDANGNITVDGGTVSGEVTHPEGATYLGPSPFGGIITGTPNLPVLPVMPAVTNFPTVGSTAITSTKTITPGSYGSVILSGNKILTLSGTGVYVFKLIKNSGSSNNFVFDFKNDPTGAITIYVYGDVDLNKVQASLVNGGSESRIYLETHGTGVTSFNKTVSFNIANGSSEKNSKWMGSVWAPYAAINIGSGTGNTNITGALWSGTQVSLQSGNNIIFAPFSFCTPPTANAGANQSTCSNSNGEAITGASATFQSGVSWTTSGTGTFTNENSLTPTYLSSAADSTAGSVVLTLTAIGGGTCSNATSTKTLTIYPAPDANAGLDKALDANSQAILTGTSSSTDASFSWKTINGGVINTATNQATITVGSAGTYILTLTVSSGCSQTDTAIVTSKLSSIIGSELESVFDNYNSNTTAQPSPFFSITPDGYITIDIIVFAGNYTTVLNLLQTTPYGLKDIITNGTSSFIITGKIPIVNLPKLNLLGNLINYCRPYYLAVVNNGLVNSAGDTTVRSILVRSGYNLNGSGVGVGVISNSFATITSGTTATLPLQPTIIPPYKTNPTGTSNPIAQTFTTNSAAQDITNGDLPGPGNPNGFTTPVTVLQDFPIQQSDEGRAMLQIIHDVAPGAQLYFRTGFFSAGDFAVGIKQLRDAGCNVIVDDVTFITEPFLQDGIVAKTVDTVSSQGVSYFSAAGNFANKSYENNFSPVDAGSIGFAGKKAHNFGGGDMFQKVRLAPGNYTFVLQWVDSIYSNAQAGGTKNDMDIYLTKNTDGTALIGYNRDNTNGDPIEFIPITISGIDSVDYNVLIVNSTASSNPSRIKYVVFSGGIRFMEYNQGTSTIVGQANADSAIAVGAARFNYVPNYINNAPAGYPITVPNDPANPSTKLALPQIESFSSPGGTQTNGVIRNKPDLVAPDGVNTTVKLGQDYPDWAPDGYSNFFGTSASAPHAAAVAALIIQGKKKFEGQTTTTPYQIRKLLQASATSMRPTGLVGYDYNSGYGLINADSAMRTFAAPTPEIDSILIPVAAPVIIPGDTIFIVTIKGQNLSSNSIIYLNDSALASTKIINSTEATALIPKFDSNPPVRLYTPPFSSSQTDGGYSNNSYFFQGSIVVSADSITKKYGELLPSLDTTITINGVRLQDTTLTLADIGLGKLTLTTAAATNSDVGTYVISPSGNFDKSDPVDSAFLIKYHYRFVPGIVTINKMPLTVTPDNQTITYGQYPGNVKFAYNYDHSKIPNTTSFDSLISAYHQSYLPTNALAVVKDFAKKQSDGSVLTPADLTNMNMMTSFRAVNNSGKFQLDNNNQLIPLSDPNSFNAQYIVDVASESILNYKKDPSRANFYGVHPGINSKALLGAASLTNNTAKVYVNGSLVQMVNGSLVQMVNGTNGSLVPIANGSLVQLVNGSLVQLVNGQYVPIPNSSPVQLVNGSLVQLVNGVFTPIPNGSLVQLVNGSLVQMVNGSLVQLVNGSLVQLVNGQYVPIENSSLVQLVNGSLVQFVNGVYVPVPNGSLVQLVNGSLVQLVNGSLVQLVNGDGSTETPIINGSLVQLVNGSLVQLVNGIPKPILNGSLVQLVNGSLVQMVNGSLVQLVNGSLVQLVNGSLVQLVNGSLVQLVNSNTIGAGSANNNTAVIIDTTDVDLQTNWIGPMFGINMITGLTPGKQSLVPGVLVNPDFDITYGLGTVTINPDTLIVAVKDTSRPYDNANPAFSVTYSGFAAGDSLENSVTGVPSISTSATTSSPEGTYPIIITKGTLASSSYVFKFVNGTLTVTNNPCLLTHSTFTGFGNTTPKATSLWLNVLTKMSGELKANGDYLLFTAGTITLNNITSAPLINNVVIPDGKIIADNTVSSPVTSFDVANNIWITKVPLGFKCTPNVFITGAIINSGNGFVKTNSYPGSTVKGIFYSTTHYCEQWAYGIAAYQPQFTYSSIAASGKVAAIQRYYPAGTPIPEVKYLVRGGTTGDKDNYCGSTSAYDNFTACDVPAGFQATALNQAVAFDNAVLSKEIEITSSPEMGTVQIVPNPASSYITISFVPARTGYSKIALYSIDEKMVYESENGLHQAGKHYIKNIDVSKYSSGIYLVQVSGGDKTMSNKVIISR